jgi:HK97 family phage major capsid protein
MSEQLIKAIDDLGSKVDARYEGLKKDLTDRLAKAEAAAVDGQAADMALKTELTNISNEIIEFKKLTGEMKTQSQKSENVYDQMKKNLEANQDKFEMKQRFKFDITDLHRKAIMSSEGHLSGTNFVEPQVVPGWLLNPYETAHIRNVIPSSSLTSDKIAYVQQTSNTSLVAEVAEGGSKPQSEAAFEKKIVLVTKLAHHYRIPEEMLDDNSQLSSSITFIGLEELRKLEDNKFLYKNGAGNEFDGLTVSATAFNDPTGMDLTQNYDVLVAAITQLRKAYYQPNFIFMNPSDVADMILTKLSDGQYLFPDTIRTGSPQVLNVPIITHEHIGEGEFLLGDRNMARIWDRKGAEVRFFEQDQDNAIKNLVTIVIEERTSLAVYRPSAFVYGGFAFSKSSY